jgi:hypothetical protein
MRASRSKSHSADSDAQTTTLAPRSLPDILSDMNETPMSAVCEPDDADSADPDSPGLIPAPQRPTDSACRRSSRLLDLAGAAR